LTGCAAQPRQVPAVGMPLFGDIELVVALSPYPCSRRLVVTDVTDLILDIRDGAYLFPGERFIETRLGNRQECDSVRR